MKNLIVIGDDLTGTVDCTSLGVRCGCSVRVESDCNKDFEMIDNTKKEVLGINISSRTLKSTDAYELSKKVTNKFTECKDDVILKKMDTGFRGNAGAEIQGMLESTGKDVCFVLEHIPMRKTFTLYGHQYSGGSILSKSYFATDDKLNAPKESLVANLIAKHTELPIGNVYIDSVKGDDQKLINDVSRVIDSGKKIVVFDVITADDGYKIISLLDPLYNVMWAGSTGVVENLLEYLYGKLNDVPIKPSNEVCIGFSGTNYKATKEQLAYAKEKTGLEVLYINIDKIIDGNKEVFDDVVNKCVELNRQKKDVIVTHLITDDYEVEGVEKIILNALCECASRICNVINFDRLVVVGGETSQAIFGTLGIDTLSMDSPPAIGTGVGDIACGKFKGKKFAIKGGSIGPTDVIVKLLNKYSEGGK